MAISLFELGFLLKAIDGGLTGALTKLGKQMNAVNYAAQKGVAAREFSGNLALLGAGALTASAAIALPLKSAVEGYEELQDHIARLGAALGNAPDKLKQLGLAEEFVKQQAVATGFGMDDLTESLYQGLSGFLTMSQAMAVSTQAAMVARATQGDLAATTDTLATMMLNFGDKTKTPIQNAQMLADKLTAIQTQGKWTTITDLQYALKDSAPAANAFGVSLDQTLAALSAWSAAGLDSSNAGTAFLETMGQLNKAAGKIGFDVITNPQGGVNLLATVEELRSKFAGMSRSDFGKIMVEGFGLRAGPRIVDLIDKLDKFKQATDIAGNSTGASVRAFAEFEQRGTLAFSQLCQALSVLSDDVGAALAPGVERVAKALTGLSTQLISFSSAHPTIVKYAAEFAAWTSVVLGVLGAIALLGASLSFIGSYVPLVLAIINPFRLWAIATKAVTAAQWLLNAAMDANPIGLVIAGVAALIAVSYELYEHWNAVKVFFQKWGLDILGFIVAPFAMIPFEIYKHIGEIENAAKSVAHAIARFFVGHSPIPEGPLHDLNMSRAIARTLEPAPMLDAIRRVALVTAIAAPMMIGAGVPAMAAGAGASRGGAGISINYAPTINIGAGAKVGDLRNELRRHAREIADLIDRERAKRARTELE